MVVFGQSGCIREKYLFSGKVFLFGLCGCIRAKVVVFGQSGCFREKAVVFVQNCILSIVVVFWKNDCIRARRLYSGRVVVFRAKWL